MAAGLASPSRRREDASLASPPRAWWRTQPGRPRRDMLRGVQRNAGQSRSEARWRARSPLPRRRAHSRRL
eukprot:10065379-Alexandrium_andersonii.AAC.1